MIFGFVFLRVPLCSRWLNGSKQKLSGIDWVLAGER